MLLLLVVSIVTHIPGTCATRGLGPIASNLRKIYTLRTSILLKVTFASSRYTHHGSQGYPLWPLMPRDSFLREGDRCSPPSGCRRSSHERHLPFKNHKQTWLFIPPLLMDMSGSVEGRWRYSSRKALVGRILRDLAACECDREVWGGKYEVGLAFWQRTARSEGRRTLWI